MTSGTTAAPAAGQRSVDPDRLRLLDAWWRAANYLSVGQIYLLDQPAAARAAASPSTSSRGCSGTGAPARA